MLASNCTDAMLGRTTVMKCQVVNAGDTSSEVRLSGRITSDVVADRGDHLRQILGDDAHARQLLVDLSETDFLDSSGIGWLLDQHRRCKRAGGILVLHSIPPMVAHVMQLMNLHRAFHIATDAASARAITAAA
jgi:anti-sigma B factor antagonist